MPGARERRDGPQGSGGDASRGPAHGISRWEWLAAALGLLLLLGVLGMLLAKGAGSPESPPSVSVRVREVGAVAGGWLVRFEAENLGDRTAAGLRLQGSLAREGTVIETAETQLDYLPGRSTREGGLYFANDPREGTLTIRPVGYQEP